MLELEECVRKYNVKTVYSMDDLFTLDEDWIEAFAEEYQKRINLPLFCHVRPGTVTPRMVNSLKKANCNSVFYGIDSGNEQMRYQLLNRRMKNDAIIASARLLKESGFRLTTSSIFCLPDETREQMLDTVNLVKAVKSDYAYTYIYYPFPNTESFDYCVENNLLDKETIAKIYDGEGSFHKDSLLKSGEFQFAQNLKYLLPLSVKFPWLSPLINIIIKNNLTWLGKTLFLITAPITHAEFGRAKIKEIISIARCRKKIKSLN